MHGELSVTLKPSMDFIDGKKRVKRRVEGRGMHVPIFLGTIGNPNQRAGRSIIGFQKIKISSKLLNRTMKC